MADVITRFKLETTQYDSKLRDAAKGLKEVAHQAELGGKGFTGFNQKAIDAARALGTIESGANNTKDRLKDLVGSFNDAAKAYNNLSKEQQQSDFGKAMAQSLTQLQQRIKETKQELYGLGDATKTAGLFGESGMMKGMLQVAGGNLITMAGSWAASLVGDVKDAIVESAELAKQAEGVQIAFARLGRGDILDGLREATHGTVSDFELMKAAVKFNDFKLPLEELGSMLAFSQKKAKDTGQSVDYMVDSIVTGLGRKSLMILDNLGLSAAEIRDKMKETGDMTKAVGEIIREQMAKAGEYVDTTADKMNRAQAELNNAMLELGTTMREVTGFSGWSDMATAIKTEVVGALQFTIETIGEAKNAWNSFMQTIGVKDKPKKSGSSGGNQVFPDGTYWETTDAQGNVTASGRWLNGKRVQTGLGDVVVTGHTPDKSNTRTTPKPTKSVPKELTEMQSNQQRINELTQEYVKISDQSTQEVIDRQSVIREEIRLLEERNSKLKLYQEQAQGRFMGGEVQTNGLIGEGFRGFAAADLNVPGLSKDKLPTTTPVRERKNNPYLHEGEDGKQTAKLNEVLGGVAGGMTQIAGGLEQMGIEIPEGINKAIGVVQGISAILTGIATTLIAIEAISAADTIIPFARGGIVPHAANGYYVPGNHYSGDVTPILANAGELVLSRSQQNALAGQLQGSGMAGMQLSAVITGEQLRLVLNNNGRRTGRGEYVTTNFR